MIISRRQFLKYCTVAAGAIGLTATDLLKLENALAVNGALPVIWINGQSCTGCTVSLANTVYYATIQDLLLFGAPADSINLKVSETLMASMSTQATQQADLTSSAFVLAVEGAIPTPDGYCTVGSYTGAATENMSDVVTYLGTHANCAAILAIGTCASYGGIPGAAGNVTGAKGVLECLGPAYKKKIACIPGCPPNPNWIVGSIAYMLANNYKFPQLDNLRRPNAFYPGRLCNSCSRFGNNFIDYKKPDDIGNPALTDYCLKKVGCKGSKTKSDCPTKQWHSPGASVDGVNWCVGAGAPCQGCTQNSFPDKMSPFHYIR